MNFPVSYLRILFELLIFSIHPLPVDIEIPSYGVDGEYRMQIHCCSPPTSHRHVHAKPRCSKQGENRHCVRLQSPNVDNTRNDADIYYVRDFNNRQFGR
ncbi:hypothetical protein DPMN_097696 [Dreissena polymorpha]|uniref:Secreted protein n=1 Tax=Dreissena polymorpha TaxID=45954 RepID=A0A9D4R6L2_DREPO|nr:hypothetical protein DPMN_097696 [Dreissena polymorpha]